MCVAVKAVAGKKIPRLRPCGFDPRPGHHYEDQTMKSTQRERIQFYSQVALIRIMYWKYGTYLLALGAISFFIPLYCLYRAVRYEEEFVEPMTKLYDRISNSLLLDTYLYNKDRLESEINQKRKDL